MNINKNKGDIALINVLVLSVSTYNYFWNIVNI